VFATNLSNQTYVAGQQGNNEFLGAPRQYGIRLGASF
jgi:iron complex outermembrane recepter protein